MTLKELDAKISENRFTRKTVVAKWRYVRYTVWDTLFAAISESSKGPILTVWGRYADYETAYPKFVMPSVCNEPRHYTDIVLSGAVPDSAIEDMVAQAYRSRRASVPTPCTEHSESENVPYCGIMPAFGADSDGEVPD